MKARFFLSGGRSGFSLTELLVVIAIMAILSSIAVPAMSLIKSDQMTEASNTLMTLCEQARTDAMARDTHVYLGLAEMNAAQPIQSPGVGRVVVQLFAALDGTDNLAAANLEALTKPMFFNNLHLPTSLDEANSGGLSRPAADYFMGGDFPAPSSPVVSGPFIFSKVLEFTPQGSLVIPSNPTVVGIDYVEIDLQPANGNGLATAGTARNVAALQIDGLTGEVALYRP